METSAAPTAAASSSSSFSTLDASQVRRNDLSCQKQRAAYVYNRDFGNHFLGPSHPMKPHRVAITDRLVAAYNISDHLSIYNAKKANNASLTAFHDQDYINYLNQIDPKYHISDIEEVNRLCSITTSDNPYNLGDDCPNFYGIYDYSRMYAGSTLKAASLLMNNEFDIAINWSGGLHHGKKSIASGFCYVNDIVLAIMMLLQKYRRILYIDIDVHHGDGVQEALYLTDRVLSLSIHSYGNNFFPGTGSIFEIGHGDGLYHSMNVPLRIGVTDEQYVPMFKKITDSCIERYRPDCIILQCGCDSLIGDCLGKFNLSISAHGECVKHIKEKWIKLLVLGGGGYKVSNVSRCWTYETSILADHPIPTSIPDTEYNHYFRPFRNLLKSNCKPEDNQNSASYIEAITQLNLELLKNIEIAPNTKSI